MGARPQLVCVVMAVIIKTHIIFAFLLTYPGLLQHAFASPPPRLPFVQANRTLLGYLLFSILSKKL